MALKIAINLYLIDLKANFYFLKNKQLFLDFKSIFLKLNFKNNKLTNKKAK